ncbi:putative ribonuclease H-like domain-containing protein [Tanacetum coccineum]
MVTGNNYNRVDYDYYAKTSHPSNHRNMTPRSVLLKSGLTPLSTARHHQLILSGQMGSMLLRPQHVRASHKMNEKDLLTMDAQAQTEKGIKREYSIARTPQQNRVAERRNMTLIEAARTMLVDSKLPTTFCKFDGKSDEGFFVGYSLSSKAFRVYNTRTKKVEENLHVGFLENKPMIEGNGPKWLFDIDSLTQSMNYVPVAAGIISNESARIMVMIADDKKDDQDDGYDDKNKSVDKEVVRLQEQFNEEETQRIARDAEIARQLHEVINKAEQEKVVAKDDQAHVID